MKPRGWTPDTTFGRRRNCSASGPWVRIGVGIAAGDPPELVVAGLAVGLVLVVLGLRRVWSVHRLIQPENSLPREMLAKVAAVSPRTPSGYRIVAVQLRDGRWVRHVGIAGARFVSVRRGSFRFDPRDVVDVIDDKAWRSA